MPTEADVTTDAFRNALAAVKLGYGAAKEAVGHVPGVRPLWEGMEWVVNPRTGGLGRVLDLLWRGEMAGTAGAKAALERFYFQEPGATGQDVLKQYGRGWAGKEKAMMPETIMSPRYGEFLTWLARFAELSGPHGRNPAIEMQLRSHAKRTRGWDPYEAMEKTGPVGPMRAAIGGMSDMVTPEGYARTKTVLPAPVHGLWMGLGLDPIPWLRGAGLTRPGQALKLKGGMNIGKKIRLTEPAASWADMPARSRGWMKEVADVMASRGGYLPAGLPPAREAAEQGFRAAIRTASGTPLWSGAPVYRAAEKLRGALGGRGLMTRAVDEIAGAWATEWRPLYSKAGGAELPQVMDDKTWAQARLAVTHAVEGRGVEGAHAVKEMLAALDGVSIPKRDAFVRMLHAYETTGEIPEGLAPVMKALKPWREKIWPSQLQRLGGRLMKKPYYPHLFPGAEGAEAYRGAKEALRAGEVVAGRRGPMKPAAMSDFSDEILKLMEPSFAEHRKFTGTYAELVAAYPKLRRTHPVLSAAERTRVGAETGYMLDGVESLARRFGKRPDLDELMQAMGSKTVPPGWFPVVALPKESALGHDLFNVLRTPDDLARAANAQLPVYLLPGELVEFSNRFSKAMSSADWPAIIKGYRKYLGVWKVSHLGIYPSYYTRNFVTENFWSFLDSPEALSPLNVWEARKIMGGRSGSLETIQGPWSYQRLREYVGPRLEHQGLFSAEEPSLVARKAISSFGERVAKPASIGLRKMAGPVEDFPRWTHFIHRIKQGDSIDDAIETVHGFHINYGRLTNFQNQWLKTVFPFSTFPIGASKIMVRETVRQPAKVAGVGRAMRLGEMLAARATGRQPPIEEYIPEHIRRRGPVFVGGDETTDRFIPQMDYTPMGQFEEMAPSGGALSQAVRSATGPGGNLWNLLATGEDPYTGRDIVDFPGQKDVRLGRPVDPKLWYALNMLPYSRIVSDLDRYNPGNIFGTATEPGIFGHTRRYEDPSGKSRLIQYLTGIKILESDREEAAGKYVRGQQDIWTRQAWQSELERWERNNPDLAAYYQALAESTMARASRLPHPAQ